jgi:cytochrome P450
VWHTRVIHKSLARHLNALIPGVQDEVYASMDAIFGTDTENWKTLNLWDAWLGIVPKVTNRMLVGSPTCRNEEFLKCMVSFTDDVVRNSFLLNVWPKITHPVIAPLAVIPNWWHWRKSTKHVVPVIKQRLHDMARKEAGDPEYVDWVEPEDFITWDIRLAKAEGNFFELDPYVISKRLLPIEFAAIHTTVITGHNVILDLMSSDPERGYIPAIREEASRVLAEESGAWSKASLSRLYKVDSAIRESMRLSNFATTLVERKVITKEGITNTKEGWHAPYGGFITLNLQGIHHDQDHYPEPHTYDAFRHSRDREAFVKTGEGERDAEEGLRLKKLGMVTTSDMHLAFGHGRHAW